MKTFHHIHIISSTYGNRIGLIGITVFLSLGMGHVSSAREVESLSSYVQIALEQNYEILAAQSRWEEKTEKTRQAGAIPDPKLGVQYFLQPIETRTGPQEASISLTQAIPWPGKLSLDKDLKQIEADITKAFLNLTQLAVVRKIKEAYIEYSYLGQARKITGQILELMLYLEGIASTNYSSGKASYADILKLQIEIEKLKNKQQSLDDRGEPARVQINSLLGTDRNMARPQPTAIPQVFLNSNEEDIHIKIRRHSPKILAVQHKITRNQTDLDIADQGFYPDFTLSVKTILTGEAEFGDPPDSGQDPVVAGLSVTLPVFYGRRNGAIAEKQASVRTARNELEQALKTLDAQAELILFRYREADRLAKLYQDNLIPKVHQQLDVMLESFQTGQSSILELIDAEKSWLTFELASVRAQADMALQVARLEELTGTTLTDWNQDT